MLKHVYKGIILFCIFIGSLYYFGQDMKEEVFNFDKTIPMSESSFPIITIRTSEYEINQLHGYSNNLSSQLVRDSITPLSTDQTFHVVINENENVVKRVIYELRSLDDNKVIETDTINALEKEGDKKTARIKFKQEIEQNKEYTVKITLITSESRKMHYYTRIKILNDSYYKEKEDFVLYFHNIIMDKEKASEIIKYLENPVEEIDNSSLSYVNIYSDFDLVRWGNLEPKIIGEIIPTVKEIHSETASIELKYMIEANTDSGSELFFVNEYFRVRYTPTRMYLLNYDRSMESVFDMDLVSLTKNELKVGITKTSDIPLVISSDNSKLSFVRQRELWFYNLAENNAVKVFSFRQKNSDNIRDVYSEHDVKILNMDDNGNIDFIVYGYMNRGAYEGHVGIILYKYYSGDNRIEEQVYIPVDVTYQILKEELKYFNYINQLRTFYFYFDQAIYSYNLITKTATIIATDLNHDNFIFSKDQHYIAWQDNNQADKATNIILLDLESGEEVRIKAPLGMNIKLLGKINNNIIYGLAKHDDIIINSDGSTLIPMTQIMIADNTANVLKDYKKDGYYITGVTIDQNVITLTRKKKITLDNHNYYEPAEPDNILNKLIVDNKSIGITTRVTEKTLTEVYISIPLSFKLKSKPKISNTVNTIITEDTTLRLEEIATPKKQYYVYALGGIQGNYDSAREAVRHAYELAGVVLNRQMRVVWERIVRSSSVDMKDIDVVNTSATDDSMKASVQMLLTHFGLDNINPSDLSGDNVYEMLDKNIGDYLLNLSGSTLDEILYYINSKRPVLAMTDHDNAVLIVGYDSYNIIVIDPKLGTRRKVGLNDGAAKFNAAGNIFYTYEVNKD